MSTVAFHTLGCKVNHYETEAIWQLFKEANYERVDFEANADVFVTDTCTVTNTGDEKSRQIIRRAIRQNPDTGDLCIRLLCGKLHQLKLWKFLVSM